MAMPNPFKELESDAVCPPHLKTEIVSEIELIRNAVTLVDIYIGDLFALASALVNPPTISNDNNSNGTAS